MARVEMLQQQLAKAGRPIPNEAVGQLKDEVIAREIFMQEAQKRGLDATDDYKAQLELARQTILIRELFADYQKKNPVTDAEVQAEYDKFAAANSGKEYKARHILVETEDQAKKIIVDLKKGQKFEDIAKKQSKDPGLRRQWRRPRLGRPLQLRRPSPRAGASPSCRRARRPRPR